MKNLKVVVFSLMVLFFNSTNAQVFTTGTLNQAIPPGGTTPTCYPITVSGLSGLGIIDVNYGVASVCINIDHTWVGDLRISLVAPDGTTVLLVQDDGNNSGVNFTGTCFTAAATVPISATAIAPFTGDYLAAQNLGAVNNGQSGNGVWTLCVLDTYDPSDDGTMLDWSINFNTTPAPPPSPTANIDEPCNAFTLTPDASCIPLTFDNTSATPSTSIANPSCGTYQGGDVWFNVVVPAGGSLKFDTQAGTMLDGAMAIYSGNCSNLTEIACDDNTGAGNMPQINSTTLTPGSIVWIRVWAKGTNPKGTFSICITTPPPPPPPGTNFDEPCGATPLPVEASCNFLTFDNTTATATTGAPAPGCANYLGGDVWFTAVVPSTGGLNINTQTGVLTDAGMAVYSGTCGNLTLIDCDDDSSPNGLMPLLSATGLTPGDTIWIRVWEYGNDNNGTFGICVTIPPPPPTNDEPCNAIPLTPDVSCNYQTYTNENSSGTTGVPAPGCSNYAGGDVWFSVVVPQGGGLVFDSQIDVITDGGMALYTGTCGSLNLFACDDDASANGLMPKIQASGLTPGDTVWVRFWEYGNDNNGAFGLCVTLPPPPPANDEPCGAVLLTADATCNAQTFSNDGSTGSTTAPAPGCAGYVGGDVWFKVEVPTTGRLKFDTQTGVVTDGGMAVYSGTCDNLNLLACDDNTGAGNMPQIVLNNLTPGDTVWVRFWDNGNNTFGDFDICITIPPPPPTNDEPCNAISLTPDVACNYQTYSNENASTTQGVPAPGCANYQGGDVWFSVVVPPAGGMYISAQVGVVLDPAIAVYTGSCGNLTLVGCDDDSGPGLTPKLNLAGLTPGDTVWIRAWEFGNDNNGTFGLCVTLPPPPPTNDEPCTAFPLPVNSSCQSQTFTNDGATTSTGMPDPGCAGYSGSDVWFTVQVPAYSTSLLFDTQGDVVTDGGMAVYTGASCSNLALLACDDNSGTGNMPQLLVSNLAPGSTLWVRVWENGNNNNGNFGICITTITPLPTCSSNQPAGNSCDQATSICNFNGYCGNTDDNIYTPNSWPALAGAFCGSIENNSFISFVASADTVAFNVWVTDSRDNLGMQMFFYETNICGSGTVTSHGCYSPIVQSNLPRVITGSNLVPGQTYYLMFDGYAGDSCGYRISPIRGVAILNITPSNPIICAGSNITLTASGGTNYTWTGAGLNTNSGAVVIASPTLSTTYTLSSTTAINNCPLTIDVLVTIAGNTAPPTVGPNVTYCQGATASPLAANGLGLLWYNAATGGTGTSSLTPSTANVGPVTYYVTQTLTCGESPRVPLTVTVNPSPLAPGVTSPVTYCQGSPALTLSATGTNLLWYTAAIGGTGSSTAPTPLTTTVGPTSYYVSQSALTCEGPRASILVNVNASAQTPSVTTPVTYCQGVQAAALSATGTSLLWYTLSTGGTGSSAVPTPSTSTSGTTTYYVTQGSSCGESPRVPINVIVNPTPAAPTTSPVTYCKDAVAAQLTATGTGLLWYTAASGGTGSSTAPTPSTATAGTTTYFVSQPASGCESPRASLVVTISEPKVDAGGPIDILLGGNAPVTAVYSGINSGNIQSILWTPAAEFNPSNTLNTTVTPVATSGSVTYQISVTNTDGCTATDNLVVNVNNQCIDVRNAFSPNGDGVNDNWQVYDGRSCLSKVSVTVFNRYGSKVFENSDYYNGWTGIYQGKAIPDGTYYAVIEFTLVSGKKITTRTDVTVIR